jgi:four helix bundle protein
LHSETSVGANIREALNRQGKRDFIHKLSISQKECDETIYWLELLFTTEYISKEEFEDVRNQASEILKIIRSIILTTKSKNS